MTSFEPAQTEPATVCYLHNDRPTGVTCQRCDKHICTSCMHQASVGVHCPQCVRGGTQKVYTRNTMPGARGLVTQALIGLNIAAFVAQVAFYNAGATTAGSTAGELALNAWLVQNGEWWRIVTSGFLHFGVFHLGMNMYSLWVLGLTLEPKLGPTRFGLAYMASLFGGSLGALLVEPRSLVMGASGAIFGLLGLLVVLFRSRGISINQSGLGPILLLNAFISLSGFVSLGGHAGGFITGLVLGVLFFGTDPATRPAFSKSPRVANLVTGALAIVLIAACIVAAGLRV